MTNLNNVGIVCFVCAGSACSMVNASEEPTKLDVDRADVRDVAHIYFNIVSGERVVTLLDDGQVSGADNGSDRSIWSSRVSNWCEVGSTSDFFFGLDDNSRSSSLATGASLIDWGDIPTDTIVDCVYVHWVTDHDDVDIDSDGIGDGVEGLSGQWTFYDCENGRILNDCVRTPVISFLFTDLPGDVSGTTDPSDPNNELARYSANVDLGSEFSSSFVFEFGDSDGDLQGAAFANNNIDTNSDGIGDGGSIAAPGVDRDFDGLDDADLDGDGLFDWGWSVRFRQPGTADLDSDGVNEGDLEDSFKMIGVSFGAPSGEAIENGDGTWEWELATSGDGRGAGSEDAFSMHDPQGAHAGTFWFGGFSCTPDDDGQVTVRASFEMELFGPDQIGGPCNPSDLAEPYSVMNFFDVSAFLSGFNAQDDVADLAEPFGVWNFFDVSEFLGAFSAGCP